MNILNYLDWRGDITFAERPCNEVDNLIFSTLAYVNMDALVSYGGEKSLTIEQLLHAYREAGYDQSHMVIDPQRLLAKAADSERYHHVEVKWYTNEIDVQKQLQFSAVTFVYAPDEAYVAFRGTDNTLVGWREDCNMSYLPETPGQHRAAEYLTRIARLTNGRLTVGGHSKGGNFAVYAAAFCEKDVQSRIAKVYSNDGPGFNNEIASSEAYLSVIPKTEHIITDSSLVGILLSAKTKRTVIKSSAVGVDQHNPYTWNVLCTAFEKAGELSQASIFMDNTLDRWIGDMSDKDKQFLVNAIFDSLESTGASTLDDLSSKKWEVYNAVVKGVAAMDPLHKTQLGLSLKKLFDAGKEALKSMKSE